MTTPLKVVTTLLLIIAIGVALYQTNQIHHARAETQNLKVQQATLTEQIKDLEADLAVCDRRHS